MARPTTSSSSRAPRRARPRSSHAASCVTPSLGRARASNGSACAEAIASPPTCPTSQRRSSPCSRRRASARCGRRAHPSSASRACSTDFVRSSRRFSSPSMATVTARRRSIAAPPSRACGRGCRRFAPRSACPTSRPHPTPIRPGPSSSPPKPRRPTPSFPSTTRSGSSSRRGPPASPRRSPTATAASRSSSRSRPRFTATSARAIAISSIARPAG